MTACKTLKISSRRYLGSKYKLLPFIKGVVEAECTGVNIIANIFSGTGVVASAFPGKKVITNDILYSNYICNFAWFSPEPYDQEKIGEMIAGYNQLDIDEENYQSRIVGEGWYKECCYFAMDKSYEFYYANWR